MQVQYVLNDDEWARIRTLIFATRKLATHSGSRELERVQQALGDSHPYGTLSPDILAVINATNSLPELSHFVTTSVDPIAQVSTKCTGDFTEALHGSVGWCDTSVMGCHSHYNGDRVHRSGCSGE